MTTATITPLRDQGRSLLRERNVSYCSIWDLVAAGEPCPACEDSFQARLDRARGGRGHRPRA